MLYLNGKSHNLIGQHRECNHEYWEVKSSPGLRCLKVAKRNKWIPCRQELHFSWGRDACLRINDYISLKYSLAHFGLFKKSLVFTTENYQTSGKRGERVGESYALKQESFSKKVFISLPISVWHRKCVGHVSPH